MEGMMNTLNESIENILNTLQRIDDPIRQEQAVLFVTQYVNLIARHILGTLGPPPVTGAGTTSGTPMSCPRGHPITVTIS